jgi:formylglycine-generating enzyme required for sulfatase activity
MKLPMKKFPIFLFIFFSEIIHGQVPCLMHYFLPELLNTEGILKLGDTISFQKKNFSTPPLEFPDCVYFNDVVDQWSEIGETFSFFKIGDIPSLRFNKDSAKNNFDSLNALNLYPLVKVENYTQPFYFRKYEVTNGEYEAFVSYVCDSVARRTLAYNGFEDDYFLDQEYLYKHGFSIEDDLPDSSHWPLNKKIDVHWYLTSSYDYASSIDPMYYPQEDPFIPKRKINPTKINFEYYYDSTGIPIPYSFKWEAEANKKRDKNIINVYPDTLCWIHDFNFPGTKEMSDNYFWNPQYSNYPVVGITYDQAKAFLNWKTIEEQKKLDAKGIKLKVEYDLPNEMEWEIAATTEMVDGQLNSYGKNYYALADNSWITDLLLDSAFANEKTKNMTEFSKRYFSPMAPFDSYVFTAPANLQKVKSQPVPRINGKKVPFYNSEILKQLDGCGISFMGGNVSEWLHQDYSDWRPAFLTRLKMLHSIDLPEAQEEYEREIYFDSFNLKTVPQKKPVEGWNYYSSNKKSKVNKLVRGANWFDERSSFLFGKNVEGTNAKCFVDPEVDHCTLGFRYVVRVGKR